MKILTTFFNFYIINNKILFFLYLTKHKKKITKLFCFFIKKNKKTTNIIEIKKEAVFRQPPLISILFA